MLPKFNNNNNIFKKPLKNFGDLASIIFPDDKTKTEIRFNDNSLKSHDIAELKFTNYLESKDCNEYKILTQICNDWKNKENILEKYFNISEEDGIYGSGEDKKQRLCRIISHSEKSDINIEYIQNMSKGRYNNSSKHNFPLRIYVKIRSAFVFVIYLIDIYHLAWTDKENDEATLYNKHKTKKFCLSNLN